MVCSVILGDQPGDRLLSSVLLLPKIIFRKQNLHLYIVNQLDIQYMTDSIGIQVLLILGWLLFTSHVGSML